MVGQHGALGDAGVAVSLAAILEALRSAAATIDPLTRALITRRRDDAIEGHRVAGLVDTLLADAGVDVAAEPDELSIAIIVEALDRYVNPTKPCVYLCHPFSATDKSDPVKAKAEEAANIQNALAWLQWFVDNTTWAVGAPWIPYVLALSERTYRERGIEDDKTLIEGHSHLICVSNRRTSGMGAEHAHACQIGVHALDFTGVPDMTFEPPAPGSDLAKLLRQLIDGLVPGTLRPVDAFGVPIPQGARRRIDGCTSNECAIRNACTGSAACPDGAGADAGINWDRGRL